MKRIGNFGKTHGINGEINALLPLLGDEEALRFVLVELDGLMVPFKVVGMRRRGADAWLLTLDDIASDKDAAPLQGLDIYAEGDAVATDDEEGDGFYADDLIGYTVVDPALRFTATILDFDDSTDNLLFVAEDAATGRRHLLPIADEFIVDIDPEAKRIEMDLPEGLLNL